MLFIIDHNPCYLLSGACMLIGCRLLNSALHTPAGDVNKLLLLLGVINLYELLLIALGLVLIRRVAFKRDGRILLFLEALFLIDITFTGGVISTIEFRSGLLINTALLILAALKAFFILHRLDLPRAGRMSLFITLQIALLLAVPLFYKWIAMPRNGTIPPLAVFATWWLAGLLPMIGLLLYRLPAAPRLLYPIGTERAMGIFFVMLPFASLLMHLYSAAWVYDIVFSSAFASPVLLGLALVMSLLEGPRLQRYLISRLQFCAVVGAIWLSINFPRALTFELSPGGLIVSPLRLVLVGAGMICMYFLWRNDRLIFLWTALICVAAALLGPDVQSIYLNLVRQAPRTTLQWGLTSIATSFMLLAVGGILTMKKAHLVRQQQTVEPGVPTQ
jgi:hypothetical protein